MNKFVCIHGHFYQPPRENAWLEYVEQQDTAYPFHDWNEKITSECYAPNTASRIMNSKGKISDIVNNYSYISFNFGPTLMSWLENHQPDIYSSVLEADKISIDRFAGHGSAIAQVYNHMIMPLACQRDKITQVLWGIKDFEFRFGRFPEGMWLPETAVNSETLEVLAEMGIKYTILAPHQGIKIRKTGKGGKWVDIPAGKLNTNMPYLCRLPSGKSISLFFYNGNTAQEVAFGGLLSNGEAFANHLLSAFTENNDKPELVNIATDGETYGHHHHHGEMALTYCLYDLKKRKDIQVTNYGEFLEKYPPEYEVAILENSSWSCIHGVGRWMENCGCNSGQRPEWIQEWRKPLRESMDWLRDRLTPFYEMQLSQFVVDPWAARNEYITVILERRRDIIEEFLKRHQIRDLSREEQQKLLQLLEMQRHAMLMYTSCGWFFDEISGIETVQVMEYASRAIQLADASGFDGVAEEFIGRLEKAPSNVCENGRIAFEKFVKPSQVDLLRVGAQYAISSLFDKYPEESRIYCYTASSEIADRIETGKLKFVAGRSKIRSEITWDEITVGFTAFHIGDHNIFSGVRECPGMEDFNIMLGELKLAFERADIPGLIQLMEKYFENHRYSLWHLFKDDQRRIIDKSQMLTIPLQNAETFYRQLYEHNYYILNYLRELQIPVPRPLYIAIEYITNLDLIKIFKEHEVDLVKLNDLLAEIKKWNVEIDESMFGYVAGEWVYNRVKEIEAQPNEIGLLLRVGNVLNVLHEYPIKIDLWRAQNIYFMLGKKIYVQLKEKVNSGDESSVKWVESYERIGNLLGVEVAW